MNTPPAIASPSSTPSIASIPSMPSMPKATMSPLTALPLPTRRRRGTMLAAFIFLIPMALVLFLMVLTRLEIGYVEMKRAERRAQARLLAESALAAWQATNGAPTVEGSIDGAGSYRIEKSESKAPGATIVAVGEVESPPSNSNPPMKVVCRIEAAAQPLRLLNIAYRMEPIAE